MFGLHDHPSPDVELRAIEQRKVDLPADRGEDPLCNAL
jgi:hypothetical protein